MKKNILITGATSGIGQALVRRLAPDADLLLTGRRAEAAISHELPEGAAYVAADQSDPQAAREVICAAVEKLGWDRIDLAILNAGAGFTADPAVESVDSIRATLDTNSTAAMLLVHALYPYLLAANGRLVLIGSTAHNGAPGFASYAASKSALNGFGRALAEEWRGRIAVQVIHPGPTASGMHAKAGYDAGRAERFFLPPVAVAQMIGRIMKGNRPVSVASYARFVLGGYWIGSGA